MQHFDLIIVGGGLVGTSLAIALHDSDLKVALIDSAEPKQDDPRLFALNIGCCAFLKALNVWPTLTPHATPIQNVHVSHRGHFGAVRLRAEDLNLQALGYVVPAYCVEKAMNDLLNQYDHCTSFRPARVHTVTQNDRKTELLVTQQDKEITLSAPVIIGADGTHSTVRTALGFATDTYDYQQSAIVTRVRCSHHHNFRAYERFIEDGAIALLPLANNECALILTIATSKAEQLKQEPDDVFLAFIQDQIGFRLGKLHACHSRHIFPLRQLRVASPIKENVYLLGNAAQTLHPIAAQGFNLALYEVAMLVEAIKEKRASHKNFNKEDLFLLWEKTKKQKLMSTNVSHYLSRIFLESNFLMNQLTQLGMMGMTIVPPLRKYFLNKLLGSGAHTPKFLLSEFT